LLALALVSAACSGPSDPFDARVSSPTGAPMRDMTAVPGAIILIDETNAKLWRFEEAATGPWTTAKNVPVGSGPRSVVALGSELLAASTNSRSLTVLDATTLAQTSSVALGDVPIHLTARGEKLWVTTGLEPADRAIQPWIRAASGWTRAGPPVPAAGAVSTAVGTMDQVMVLFPTVAEIGWLEDGAIVRREAVCPDAHSGRVVPLAVACRSGGIDAWIDGTRTHLEGGEVVYDVVGADFDRDGNVDLAGIDLAGKQALIWMGRGDGQFLELRTHPVSAGPIALDLLDLGRDGDLDLVVLAFEARGFDLLRNGE